MVNRLIYFLICLFITLSVKVVHAELRDPTTPPIVKGIDIPKINASLFSVTAIILSNDRKLAVINGEYKTIGDEVLGNRINDIGKNTVQLEGPSGKITLFLLGKPIKHVAKEGM